MKMCKMTVHLTKLTESERQISHVLSLVIYKFYISHIDSEKHLYIKRIHVYITIEEANLYGKWGII